MDAPSAHNGDKKYLHRDVISHTYEMMQLSLRSISDRVFSVQVWLLKWKAKQKNISRTS